MILGTWQLPATIVFCFAQAAFASWFIEKNPKHRKRNGMVRLSLLIALELVRFAVLGSAFDLLAFVSLFFFSLLLGTLLKAEILNRLYPLFIWGLLFFALCDVFVGFRSGTGYLDPVPGTLLAWFVNPGFNLAWAFYIPAQVFITLSIYHNEGQALESEALPL